MNKNFKEIYKQRLYESINRKLMMEADDYRGRDLEQASIGPTEVNPESQWRSGSSTWMASATRVDDPSKKQQREIKQIRPQDIVDMGNGWWRIGGTLIHLDPPYRPIIVEGQVVYYDGDERKMPTRDYGGEGPGFRRNPQDGDIDLVRGDNGNLHPWIYHEGPPAGWHQLNGYYERESNTGPGEGIWHWIPLCPGIIGESGWEPGNVPPLFTIPWQHRNINNPAFANDPNKRWWHGNDNNGQYPYPSRPTGVYPPRYDPSPYVPRGPWTPGWRVPYDQEGKPGWSPADDPPTRVNQNWQNRDWRWQYPFRPPWWKDKDRIPPTQNM
jgi:hypothetical protein